MQNKDPDKQISIWLESIARIMQRRKFLALSLKGIGAATAAVALGSFAEVKQAFAITCTCHWAQGHQCTGGGINNSQCPSGCSTCTTSDWCNGWCDYSNGAWVSCTGYGTCGNGYRMCIDCKCSTCSYLCTILTGVICQNCCSPQQLKESLREVAASLKAPGNDAPSYA